MSFERELDVAMGAARHALERTRAIVKDELQTKMKAPGDPVTNADLAAERVIVAALRAAFPSDAIVSEETEDGVGDAARVWFIDPIDGTRELVKGTDEYST